MSGEDSSRLVLIGVLGRITKFLLVLAAGLALLVVYSAGIRPPEEAAFSHIESKPSKKERNIVIKETKAADFEDYAAVIKGKDMFAAPNKKAADTSSRKPAASVQQDFMLFSGGYELKGIVIDRDPVAIIEDIKKKQTMFLGQNDNLGEAVIKVILDEKVVFGYRGRDVEMEL